MKITVIAFALFILLTGCYSYKKADRQMYKAGRNYPELAAAYCSERFPSLSFVKDSIVYKPGKNEQVYVYADCDSIKKADGKASVVKIACPPHSVDSIYIYKEKQMVNRAEEELLRITLNNEIIEKAVLQRNNTLLFRCTIILAIYTMLRWVLKFWKINLL